jgi:hypothetical protein
MPANFVCPRTCPLVGQRWCRFRPVLDRLGPVRADSHTARIEVDFTDPASFQAAVESLGGTWLGAGTHRLFEGEVAGLGFRLPDWQYPLVLQGDGQLAYDDYRGCWGNVRDLERLKGAYALCAAEQAARAQGWLTERTGEGLLIHHPTGGTLTVTAGGAVDANGFCGQGCHEAVLQLGLPVTEVQAKPEFGQVAAEVQLPAP